jgi:hypothetical protein
LRTLLVSVLLILAALGTDLASAQVVLPRSFGPLRLDMRAGELTAVLTDTSDTCADECAPAERMFAAEAATLPGLRTALVALGLDSAASFDHRPGLDLLAFQGRLAELYVPPPERDLDASVHRLIAVLGPWETVTVWPHGHATIRWRDARTIIDLEAEAVVVALPDLRHGLATSIRLADRSADSLRALVARRRGLLH